MDKNCIGETFSRPVFNVFRALSSEDFSCESLTFQADPQNVHRGVAVSIVDRPTVRTFPRSYSKRTHTFRTAVGNCSAARARLGSEAFVNFDKHSVVPSGLVAKLCLQHRPARIVNGLSHSRFRKFGRADVSDRDKPVVADNLRRPLVKVVTPRIADLGVDRADAALVPGSLRNRQGIRILPVMAKGFDPCAVAARRERLQSEINTDLARSNRKLVGNLALETDIPATTGVLHEASALDCAVDFTWLPESESLAPIQDAIILNFHRARSEWHPAERTFRAEAGTKARGTSALVSSHDKLATDAGYRVGMDSEVGRNADAEIYEIKRRRPAVIHPALVAPFRLSLRGDTIIPDLIAGDRMASQVLAGRRVLDAEFKGEDHATDSKIVRRPVQANINRIGR